MEEIKSFTETFLKVEAEKNTLRLRPDIEKYNQAADKYHELVTDLLCVKKLDELEDEEVYEAAKDMDDYLPRHLFKISQYHHEKYGDVWVAYVSQSDPESDRKYLSEAFFIIRQKGILKVAGIYSYFVTEETYSTHENYEDFFEWLKEGGYSDLTFEKLEGPIEIERYQEPLPDFDGLKLYNDNI